MAGAERHRQPGAQESGERPDQQGSQHADPQAGAQRRVPDRHVRAGHEHHQAEADLGEEGEGVVGGVQHPQAGGTEQQPDTELADDDRQVRGPGEGQHRPGQRHQAQQGQDAETHGRAGSTMRTGMSVFSSVQ
ncbi:hypothetical protein SDC9_98960 [bioreactor metagenome]|uniref:Uncharacterized protein n=1 Tax=bioreactor metagenome TaxID=1076179 RepID=A0A645ARI2_9ZZZZ